MNKRWIENIVGLCLVACTHSVSLSRLRRTRDIYTLSSLCWFVLQLPVYQCGSSRDGKKKNPRATRHSQQKRHIVCANRTVRDVPGLRHRAYARLSQFFEFISTPSTNARMPDAQHLPIRRVSQQITIRTKVKLYYKNYVISHYLRCLHFSSIGNRKPNRMASAHFAPNRSVSKSIFWIMLWKLNEMKWIVSPLPTSSPVRPVRPSIRDASLNRLTCKSSLFVQ